VHFGHRPALSKNFDDIRGTETPNDDLGDGVWLVTAPQSMQNVFWCIRPGHRMYSTSAGWPFPVIASESSGKKRRLQSNPLLPVSSEPHESG